MPPRNLRPLRNLALFASLTAASIAHGEIDYRVKVDPSSKRVEVTITIPASGGPVSVQAPNWMPGHYVLDYYYKNINDVTAVDGVGRPLTCDHPDSNTWTVTAPKGLISFHYWVPIGVYRRFTAPKDDSFVQVAGAVHYMYVVGRKTEPCKIAFDLPKGWPALTGLDPSGHTPNTFIAPTYDVLIDNPLSTGDVKVIPYRLRGKEVDIALDGTAKSEVDPERILQYCRFVSASEADFFHGAPYHRYVWHFIVLPATSGGGGGLEHLSSTQINFSSRMTSSDIGLLAHEHFHLWNVKRIRPRVLGPFDYTNLPKTGNIWWSEGVTDYYASLLPYRYGAYQQPQFFRSISQNYGNYLGNSARKEVSPYESSYRLAEASGAKGGAGANGGYKISFYNLGWLCGLCLDTEIRYQTKGKHSLDDVMRALFAECKNDQPGFAEDEIKNQCVRFGGPTLGPFYDRVVMKPGDMPIEDQLGKMGLIASQGPRDSYSFGLIGTADLTGAAIVKSATGTSRDLFQAGDKITAIDGKIADPKSPFGLADLLNDYAMDGHKDPIAITLTRGDQTLQLTVKPTIRTSTGWTVTEDPKASKEAIALREQWLKVTKLKLD